MQIEPLQSVLQQKSLEWFELISFITSKRVNMFSKSINFNNEAIPISLKCWHFCC
jgi:hypothetical protein